MGRVIIMFGLIALVLWSGAVWAGEGGWRGEFERICTLTDSAGQLNRAELELLIADSDRLLELIAVEGGAEGRVYLFRLRKCRDFFVFMRDSRPQEGPGGPTP